MSGAIEVTADIRALDGGAGVRILDGRAHVEASDRHRARFLHNMTTCDIKGLAEGQGTFGMSVDRVGKLVGQLVVEVDTDVIRVELDASRREAMLAHWTSHRVADMIRFSLIDDLTVVALIGSAAGALLDRVTGEDVSSLSPYAWKTSTVAGIECRIRRNDDRLDRPGWDLTVSEASSDALLGALVDAGAVALSKAFWDHVRVRAGVPNDVADMNDENIPLEAEHLLRGISWDKGCYIGQEVIARMHFTGKPNRHLRGVLLRGERPQDGERLISDEGKEAGRLGTVSVLDGADGAIALAVIKRRFSEPGTKLQTPGGGQVEVVTLPFAGGSLANSSSPD